MAIDTGELAAKAILKEATLGTSAVDEAAKSLRTTLTQKGAEATLQVAAGRAVDPGQVDYAINENIGTERGADGKKVITSGSDEEARLNRVMPVKELLTTYLDKGYDNLTGLQQDRARSAVLDLAKSIPAFVPVLSGMGPAEQQQFAVRILKDPRFTNLVKKGLLDKIDLTKIKADNVSQLQLDFDGLTKELTAIKTELTEVTNRISDIDKEIAEYQVENPPGSGNKGKIYDKIITATGEIGAISATMSPDADQLNTLNIELEAFQNELKWAKGSLKAPSTWTPRTPAEVQKDIKAKSGEIEVMNKKLLPEQLKIQERQDLIKQLQEREKTLQTEKTEKQKRKAELEKEELGKSKEEAAKKSQLGKAKADRTQYEEQFVRGVESVLSDAGEQYIKDRVSEATTESKALLEKQAQEEKDKRARVIAEEEVKRYFDGKRIKADQARTDYNEVLINGPDKIIEEMLRKQYGAAEVTEIMKDTAFMDNMRKQVATDVVKYYMLRGGLFDRGGKIHPDEIIKLNASPWGVKVIEDAIAGNKAIQDQIKQSVKYLPESAKLGEWIRGLDFRKLMLVLLIILGILGVGGFMAFKH